MSYLVLARKWRPQGFDDLVGQESITKLLKNSISQKKIAHAYIFSGPRGVGKTSTARILAKALNCEHGPTPQPCGTCSSCANIRDGSAIDVLEIDGASNNSVDDIRDLREGVRYTPLGGRYKIYIIDEAHMLSVSAFNALLKTLEEPPAHVIFVLATTSPKKIPVTIFSRCQHLLFRRISAQKIKERLKHIVHTEGIKISDSAVEMVARAADGSMRDSLTILDQVTAFSSDISDAEVKDLLGITDVRVLAQVSEAVVDGNQEQIIKLIAEMVDRGVDLKSFAKDLVTFFRDLLVAKMVQKPEDVLELGEDELAAIKKILPKVSADILTLIFSEIVKAESETRAAFSPRISVEMSLVRASFVSRMKPVKEAIDNIEAIVKGLSSSGTEGVKKTEFFGKPVMQSAPAPEKPAVSAAHVQYESSIPQTRDSIPSDSQSVLNAILEKIEDPRIASKLGKARPQLVGNTLTLIFNSNDAEIFAEAIKKKSSLIEGLASTVLQKTAKLEILTEAKKVVRKNDLKEKALADPAIRAAVDLFDGRIIDVKLKEDTGGGKKDV